VIVVVGLGAGIYFGTDLLREPAKQESVAMQQPAVTTPETPVPPPIEEAKPITEGTDSSATSMVQPQPAELPPSPPPPVEAYKSQPEPRSKVSGETYTQQAPARPAAQSPVAPPPARSLPGPAVASRSPADPGMYETIRPTIVFDGPSPSSRVVANIGAGIRVNVVGSNGDWLEVRSKHGKPPGFIRRDDAVIVTRTN
jgi:hypothetical protein